MMIPSMTSLYVQAQTFLAQDGESIEDVFGRVDSPVGGQRLADPGTGLASIIVTGIQIAFFIGGLLLLGYLFYGAFLWITSNGEEDKLEKARGTLTQAIVGMILLVVALTIFLVVAGNILNIITITPGGFEFNLPTIRGEDPIPTPDPTTTP